MVITRRALLFSAAGAGTLATIWNGDKIAVSLGDELGLCDPPNDPFGNNPPSQSAISYDEIYARRQFTLIGDSNHSDLRIQDYFFSDQNIDHMVNAGIKNVCLERNFRGQPLFDALQKGEITPEEFVIEKYSTSPEEINSALWLQSRLRSAYGIREMGKRGIKVYCSDVRFSTIQPSQRTLDFQNGSYDFHEDMCDTPRGITPTVIATYVATNPIDFLRSFSESKTVNSGRDDDNDPIAQLIKQQCGDEPSVVFFGQGHFGRSVHSISNNLGRENVTEVILFGGQAYYTHDMWHHGDYFHFVEEEQIFSKQNGFWPRSTSPTPSTP